jgi:hypothetical protein
MQKMRRDIFTELSGANTAFSNLFGTHNVAYYDSKIWWSVAATTNVKDCRLTINSAPSVTGSTTQEDQTTITPVAAGDDGNIQGNGIYADSTYIIGWTTWTVHNDGTGDDEAKIFIRYSDDDGSSWNTLTYDIGAIPFTTDLRGLQVFKVGSNYFICYTYEDAVNQNKYQIYKFLPAQALADTQNIDEHLEAYAGNVFSSEYYFVSSVSNVLHIYSFDGTSITDEETLTGLVYSTNANVFFTKYHKYTNIEFLIDNKYFYVRVGGSDNSWTSYTDTGTDTNAYVWEQDSGGEKRPRWIVWKDTIYRIFPNGGQEVFQASFSLDAWVGWDDWFGVGSSTVYQATSTKVTSRSCIVSAGLEATSTKTRLPYVAEFLAYPPITEKSLNIKDYNGNDIFWGDIIDSGKRGKTAGQICRNSVIGDLYRPISIDAVNMAPHTYITTYLEPYWQFISSGTLDTSEAAVDIPAFNKNSAHALRWLNLRFSKTHYIIYADLTLNWDDGTTDSGKNAIQGTEKLGLFEEDTKNNPIKNVRVFCGMDSTGKEIEGFDSDNVGSFELLAWHPEIDNKTDADAMATKILTANDNSQIYYKGSVFRNGMYQIGQQIDFAYTGGDISVSSAKYFVTESQYDASQRKCIITLSKYLILPFHEQNIVNDNRQHISAIASRMSWTTRDPAAYDYDKTAIAALGDDTSHHDLDLSSIVGTGVKEVQIMIALKDNAAGSVSYLRTNGVSNAYAVHAAYTQVANVFRYVVHTLLTDSSGVIEILNNPKPSDWTNIDIVVRRYRNA